MVAVDKKLSQSIWSILVYVQTHKESLNIDFDNIFSNIFVVIDINADFLISGLNQWNLTGQSTISIKIIHETLWKIHKNST